MTNIETLITSVTSKVATQAFTSRLLAIYSIGSTARGNFRPIVSDIDVGLVLHEPLLDTDGLTVESIRAKVASTGIEAADRVSLFWGTLLSMNTGEGGRFPAVDCLDLIQNGQLLQGSEIRNLLTAPSHRQLIQEGARFALERLRTKEHMEYLLDPAQLMAAGPLMLTKLTLFPARLIYTLHTGKVGQNEAATSHYLETTRGDRTKLVAAALAWRRDPPPPEDKHALQLLREHLVPLYTEMITRYVGHPALEEDTELTHALMAWRLELNMPQHASISKLVQP